MGHTQGKDDPEASRFACRLPRPLLENGPDVRSANEAVRQSLHQDRDGGSMSSCRAIRSRNPQGGSRVSQIPSWRVLHPIPRPPSFCCGLSSFSDNLDGELDALFATREDWKDLLTTLLERRSDAQNFLSLARNCCYHGAFFVTHGCKMGLGPSGAAPGDWRVVLLGGQAPYILRPQSRGFRFIGEAYFTDVMDGQATEDWQRGKRKTRTSSSI